MFLIPFSQNRTLTRPTAGPLDHEFDRLVRAFSLEKLSAADFAPALDVQETKEGYVIQADLPGVEKKDIQVRVEDGVLAISGSRRAEHQESAENRTWHRVERSYGSFERTLRLGEGVDANAVAAEYKDGVLTVRVPKTAGAIARVVEVR